MDVIILLVFISLVLVAAALAFFRTRLQDGDLDHGDRLSLLPLLDDDGSGPARHGAGGLRTEEPDVAAAPDAKQRGARAAKEKGTAYESRQ